MNDNDLIWRGDAIRAVGTFEQYTGIAEAPIEFASQYLRDIPAIDAVEVVRCKDCRHRVVNENYGKKGYMNLKAMCDLDTGDPYEFGRDAENDDWFCADGERRSDNG